jgi:hypothetical protein
MRGTYAWIDSEMVPIWLILSNNPLQAVFSMAVLILEVLVTVKSSPTIWICEFLVKCDQASQSSWSKGSCSERSEVKGQRWCRDPSRDPRRWRQNARLASMETIGYFSMKLL